MRRNYAKKRKTARLITLFALIAIGSCGIAFYLNNRHDSNDTVLVKINQEKIYKSEIERKIKEVFAGADGEFETPTVETLPQEVIETFAKEIYLEKSLAKRAEKAGITSEAAVKGQIKDSETKIIINAYLNSLIKEKVSEEKIRDKYAEVSGGLVGQKELEIAQIVLKTEGEANKIYKSLTDKKAKHRAKFSDLAKKHSIDEDSASKGGNLGYVAEGNLAKEIIAAASTMKKGEVSRPIHTQLGWYIIKFENIKEAKAATFEDVKESIRERMIKDETSAIYSDIFKDVKIEVLSKPQEKTIETQEKKTDENQAKENEESAAESVETGSEKTESSAGESSEEGDSAKKAE